MDWVYTSDSNTTSGDSGSFSISYTTGTGDFATSTEMEQGKRFKSIDGGAQTVDRAEGIVEAFVAAIGNKDSVNDIIIPGAFEKSLRKRKPRVVWGHDWNAPIGKVLEIEEVRPGDPRLPSKMRAAGVGGLLAKVQFNLGTERGREAFASVAFFGEEQEWSIGYKTIEKDYDHGRQANILKVLELYEVSPVLHGANHLTGTISVKTDEQGQETKNGYLADLLPNALEAQLGVPVQVRHFDFNRAVYEDPSGKTYAIKFRFENGLFQFGVPNPVALRTFVEPIPEEGHEGCACGLHLGKAEVGEFDYKIGRAINSSNQEKLRQAIALLTQIVEAASPAVPEEPMVADEELKEAYLEAAPLAKSLSMVVGAPERLSGLVVHLAVKSLDEAADLLGFLEPTINSLDLAALMPTSRAFDLSEDQRVSLYLPEKGLPLKTALAPLVDALVDINGVSITHEKLDFFGLQSKSFEELFTTKQVAV